MTHDQKAEEKIKEGTHPNTVTKQATGEATRGAGASQFKKGLEKKKICRPSYCVKDAAGAGGEPNL